MAFERREFAGAAANTTLSSGINSGATTFTLGDVTNWPDGSDGDFFVVMDPGTASEEKIRCSDRTSTTFTVAGGGRGADGTSAVSHNTGAVVRFCITALDLDEANSHVSNTQANPHPQYYEAADLDGDVGALISAALASYLSSATAASTYLAKAGGTMAGDIDMDGNDLIDPVVTGAADKVYTANISGSVTIDAANGQSQILTLTGNVTAITVNNFTSGSSLFITFINDASTRTNSMGSGWLWPLGKTAATASYSTSANAVNDVTLHKRGSAVHAFLGPAMAT